MVTFPDKKYNQLSELDYNDYREDDQGQFSRSVVNPDGSAIGNLQGMLTKPYDEILITYTDSTKTTISTVKSYEAGVLQETLTLTQAATTDTWTRS